MTTKPQMMLKWQDEKKAFPISRDHAAATIRKNRSMQPREFQVKVFRKCGDTYIVSHFLNVACCIYRA